MFGKPLTPFISLSFIMLCTPVMADWPVAVADKFTIHQSYPFVELDLLKNDRGNNLTVVDVNEWSEKGARISLRTPGRSSRETYHNYGDVAYVPKEGFSGEDGFWYVIEDDQGRRNSVRVVVDVKPESLLLPTPLEDVVEVPKNQSVRINVTENDLFSNLFNPSDVTFRGEIVDYNFTSEQGGKIEKVEVYPIDLLQFGSFRDGYSIENTLKYQLKYTPPDGFVGTDSFTYAVKDSKNQFRQEVNDTVSWTKVTLNVVDKGITAPFPVAVPDTASGAGEIDVLSNDIGKNLVIKLASNYSQNGNNVYVIPNYPSRPVIQYSGSPVANDKVWYVIEDEYGRQNFSYVDITRTNDLN
ncbi:Ig-like domain-containing protein [Leucothrix pacifica]|uniref:Uncharacterized protein n=1 Tax=Leucothrix pacifica TaxID=1247513 RepID=A0A317C526_9GAMM|nr:Ig-like domain-containing protein [Leucothrix pacifica]PWQ93311.1 hypothetical protein DKW60_17780 [Leucothrix pacifica]